MIGFIKMFYVVYFNVLEPMLSSENIKSHHLHSRTLLINFRQCITKVKKSIKYIIVHILRIVSGDNADTLNAGRTFRLANFHRHSVKG